MNRSRSEPTRGAEAGDDVRDIAELLQDGVVGNGAHARHGAAIGGPAGIALPLHGARAGLEQDVRTEGAEHGAIAGMREQVLLVGAQAADEVEAQVGVLVERILGPRPESSPSMMTVASARVVRRRLAKNR